MPDCPQQETLLAYLADTCSPEDRARFQTHLTTCTTCAEDFEAFAAVQTAMDDDGVKTALQDDVEIARRPQETTALVSLKPLAASARFAMLSMQAAWYWVLQPFYRGKVTQAYDFLLSDTAPVVSHLERSSVARAQRDRLSSRGGQHGVVAQFARQHAADSRVTSEEFADASAEPRSDIRRAPLGWFRPVWNVALAASLVIIVAGIVGIDIRRGSFSFTLGQTEPDPTLPDADTSGLRPLVGEADPELVERLLGDRTRLQVQNLIAPLAEARLSEPERQEFATRILTLIQQLEGTDDSTVAQVREELQSLADDLRSPSPPPPTR